MTIASGDRKLMKRLAKEGKTIARITRENFPRLKYADVYSVVYGSGLASATGMKRMISNRLQKLSHKLPLKERRALITETNDLIWGIYINYRESQKRLDRIRSLLSI